MAATQIPGIYVEIKGDSTQLKKDIQSAKQIVTDSAKGMSNALNNALSGSQISKGTNALINNLSVLSRSSQLTGQSFKQLGVDLGSLQRVTGVTGTQFQQLQSKMLATAGAKAQEKALKDIARAADLTEKEIRELGQQFGLSKSQINTVTGELNKSKQSFDLFGAAVRTALAYFSIDALVGFARGVVDAGVKLDSLERSFTAITGSAQAAQQEFDFLRETANRTGQNFYSLTDSFRQLSASTQGMKLAGEETRKIFSSMSEAAAVLGMSNLQLELSFKAFAQMAGKGVVQMEELKGQLGDSLPGAVNIAARAMDVSVKRLMEMSQAGELLAEDLLPKMSEELHKMYGAAANTAALESGIAAINRFNQAWTDLKASLYDNKAFVFAADTLSTAFNFYANALKDDNSVSGIKEKLDDQGKALQHNKELLDEYTNGWLKGSPQTISGLTEKIREQESALVDLNLQLKQAENASDPAVKAAVEAGAKMTDAWVKSGEEQLDAIMRAQKYETKALEDQSKAEEEAARKAASAARQRAEEQQSIMSEMTDMIATQAMTQTEKELYEIEKRKAAYLEAADTNIALKKKITAAYAAEEERLTMLVRAGVDKRTAAEWEALDDLKDGWVAFNEGKADAAERADEEIADGTKETTSVLIDEWSNALESIQSSIADMIYEFDFSMDSIVDIFKRMLAEILAAIAMSGIKEALLGLFDIGEGESLFGGLIGGIKDIFSDEGGGSGGGLLGMLGLAGAGKKLAGLLGIGSVESVAAGAGITAGTSLALAEGTFGAGASGFSLSSLFGGGGALSGAMSALAPVAAGIGAVVAVISLLGDSLPPVLDQLNDMHVTAQQISSTGLSTEIGNVSAQMQEMVPALRNVALASWDASTATLSTQSAFNSLHKSMESGNETIVQANYHYDELTGTWSSSLSVIDGYRQSLYDSMLAAGEATNAMDAMGSATAAAAGKITGAANDINSILGMARQQTMQISGMSESYHADGGIIPSTMRIGSHVFGEAGPEAIVPLPYGPDSFEKLFAKIDQIGGTPVVHVYIGNEKIDSRIMVVADRLDADRVGGGRRYIS